MSKRANIYDVAERAGVSHQTVSRVLNNHSSLKPATREKVEKAIAELHYRPNQAARQLVTSQSRIIGILIAGTELYGPWAIFNAMEQEARREGYSVISISVLPNSPDSWQEGIDQLRNLNVDGAITIALPTALVKKVEKSFSSATIVIVDAEPGKKLDAVNIDNERGGALATEHLIELGHTEILHITGPVGGYEGTMRRQGYESAMAAAKLKADVIEGDWSLASGYKICKEVLSRKKIPSAIFTANDHLAFGVMKALREAEIRVPQDVSIVGFDDIPEAEYFSPSLTTVSQRFDQLGNLAINRMLSQLKESGKRETLIITPELISRESTQKKSANQGSKK
jgi:DNA-binding LacI/PurR family transcriptional regulator